MPTYDMKHIETGETKTVVVSIDTMMEMKKEGWVVVHNTVPPIVSMHGSTLGKTSGDWKDHLKRIKKHSGRGNTINT